VLSIGEGGVVRLPFVNLVRMVTQIATHRELSEWVTPLNLHMGDGIKRPQDWEEFNAMILAVRLSLLAFDGTKRVASVPAKALFRGARCGDLSDVTLPLRIDKAFTVLQAAQQFTGGITEELTVKDSGKPIDWRGAGVVVINGEHAPWADVFVYLPPFVAVQCKLVTSAKDEIDYAAEAAKATTTEPVIFMLAATTNVTKTTTSADGRVVKSDIDLGPKQVLVGTKEFAAFYGWPFADRALLAACMLRAVCAARGR
jgi:hypothetical protein